MDRTPGIRPRPSLWRRLDGAGRIGFPLASTVVMLLLTAAPFGLPGQSQLLPATAFAAVYFWTLHRPQTMPPPAVFLLGLLCDLLGYAQIGVGVLTLLILHGLALRWRRSLLRQGFALVWLAFISLAAGAAATGWVLNSLLTFRLLPPAAAGFEFLLAAALYPGFSLLLSVARHALAEPGQG